MNCPKCGSTNEQGSNFCFSCGYDLSTSQPQSNNSQEKVEPLETSVSNVSVQQPLNQSMTMSGMGESLGTTISDSSTNNKVQQGINQNMVMSSKNKKGINKNIILIVAAIAVIVIVAFAVFNLFFNKKDTETEKLNNIYSSDKLIKVKSGDNYGYIDTNGKFVLAAIYKSASDFVGDYAIVSSEIDVEGIKTNMYQLIDKKGNVKLQSASLIKYISDYDLWIAEGKLYDKSIKQISLENTTVEYVEDGYFKWFNSDNNTAGIMNSQGKVTYTYSFNQGEKFIHIEVSDVDDNLKETYCRINIENEKYAIVNCDTGKVVYDFTDKFISVDDDNIFTISNYDHSTFEFISYIYIQNDKIMYQTDNKSISLSYYSSGNYIQIRDSSADYSNRYTYLDVTTGKITTEVPKNNIDIDSVTDIITNEWEALTGSKSFSCSEGYGLMNNDKVTLPCEWDSLTYLDVNLYKYLSSNGKNYIYAKKDSKWYLINLDKNTIVAEFNSSSITKNDTSTFVYYTDADTKLKNVYNLLTNETLEITNSSLILNVYSNYITLKDNTEKTLKYYNTNLKLIYTESL